MRAWTLTLTALLVVALAAPAQAATFPGQRPADDGLALALATPADAFWGAQGRVVPCPAVVYFADLSGPQGGGAPMAGVQGGCEVWIDVAWWAGVRHLVATGDLARRRDAIAAACTAFTHERGHNLGLGHIHDGGIMDWAPAGDPGVCVAWAASLVPRRSRGARAAHRHVKRRM